MSHNTVDLFAKKEALEKRVDANVIKNKAFINKIRDRWFGSVIADLLTKCSVDMNRYQFAALSFGYQVRAIDGTNDQRLYFTGRTLLQQILEGKQTSAREVFQFRFEPKTPNSHFKTSRHNLGSVPHYMTWKERYGIKNDNLCHPAGLLAGWMERESDSINYVSAKINTEIFEVFYESVDVSVRLRIFAKTLLEDQRILERQCG